MLVRRFAATATILQSRYRTGCVMTDIERRIEQLEQTAAERALVADLSTVTETRIRNAQLADELRLVVAQLRTLRSADVHIA
ncbi:putative coiled-coil protein SlyX [Bradyrhizobium japonicum]|jgi:uncharacterized coiled-coil protein SlyX|uniref:Coiled-coil protein SlyX n=2 Tax=Nitrobacteraceae TaxID=41294 RepID=A0ABV4F210_BRAEL|nr:putative coiled-coil protein SlyX [Bradyrhizobium elkanii]QOZ17583.1 hypothetical protein XI02_23105 [Bradyrhizobium sp. CCBAU 21365]UQD77930.1 hypothetical protein JEY66_23355 [Bradyrhizobium elkanii USDA 76]NWL38270.1 hypothetical protein [Bradyrhizobium elkanii]NWL67485.1 hypothetical protein [Bradyrhizobium elkanii]